MARFGFGIVMVLVATSGASCALFANPSDQNSAQPSSVEQTETDDAGVDINPYVDLCDEGSTRLERCGVSDQGERLQRCVGGEWVDEETCQYPHTCTNKATRYVVCETGNNAVRFLTCESGVWQSGPCEAPKFGLGSLHSCAVRRSGTAFCWGDGAFGKLGNGETESSAIPIQVTSHEDFVAIDGGQEHTCALRQNGTVWCWGLHDTDGRLGTGATRTEGSSFPTPQQVQNLGDASAITANAIHACALRKTGVAVCWGRSLNGRLGPGNTYMTSTPVTVKTDNSPDLSPFVAISAGGAHTCALHETGNVSCWGYGASGRLGNGDTSTFFSPQHLVSNIRDAIAISAGNAHTCALHRGGSVSCWGLGSDGRLGRGSTATSNVPVAVLDLSDAVSISAGDRHTCALRKTGAVVCWGNASYNQLGNGSTGNVPVPIAVEGINDAVAIRAGGDHSCALRESGTLVCWGRGLEGQLGNAETVNSNVVSVESL